MKNNTLNPLSWSTVGLLSAFALVIAQPAFAQTTDHSGAPLDQYQQPQVIYQQVPVPVQVPGPTRTIYKEVPGPTRTIYREVPGPTETVIKEVPGPTRTVIQQVPGPERVIERVVNVPSRLPSSGLGLNLFLVMSVTGALFWMRSQKLALERV